MNKYNPITDNRKDKLRQKKASYVRGVSYCNVYGSFAIAKNHSNVIQAL